MAPAASVLPASLVRLALAAWTCLAVAGCSGWSSADRAVPQFVPAATDLATRPTLDSSRIAVGDSLSIAVWGYPEFTTSALVKSSGSIRAPLIGEIQAAGLTREEFEVRLREQLRQFIQGDVRVSVAVYGALPRIAVLGAVPSQGLIPTISELPLIDVLARAGGWREDSDLRYVQITRGSARAGEQPVIEVDVDLALIMGTVRTLPAVRPGDVVFVPPRVDYARKVADFFWAALAVLGIIGLLQ